jgi:hypothetical protein
VTQARTKPPPRGFEAATIELEGLLADAEDRCERDPESGRLVFSERVSRRLEAATIRFGNYCRNRKPCYADEVSSKELDLRREINKCFMQIEILGDETRRFKDMVAPIVMCELVETANHAFDKLYGVKCQ